MDTRLSNLQEILELPRKRRHIRQVRISAAPADRGSA